MNEKQVTIWIMPDFDNHKTSVRIDYGSDEIVSLSPERALALAQEIMDAAMTARHANRLLPIFKDTDLVDNLDHDSYREEMYLWFLGIER